jgi:hypothetical protein
MRGSMYEERHTAGVLPRYSATSSTAREIARFFAVSDRAPVETASATAASTVACHVRKSLALTFSLDTCLR